MTDELTCRKCGEHKSIYYFKKVDYNTDKLELAFDTKRCRVCRGMKLATHLHRTLKRTRQPIPVDELNLYVQKIEKQKKMASRSDIAPLINLYTTIYDAIPSLYYLEDEYSFMYLTLKKLSDSLTPRMI